MGGPSSLEIRAGKNLRFFRKTFRFLGFLGFLGFNVRTVARGTLDTGLRSRRPIGPTERLTNVLLCLTLRNKSKSK